MLNFRVVKMNEIDRLRTVVWMNQIKRLTGCQTVKELAAQLDPASVWTDEEGFEHQSKWYQYSKGLQVPNVTLTRSVDRMLGGIGVDLHHPTWRVLRRSCSERTWSRFASLINAKFDDTRRALSTVQLDQPVGEVFELLALSRATYLDALALLLLERRRAKALSDQARMAALDMFLAILPALYAEDVLWDQVDRPGLDHVIEQFDRALNVNHLHLDHAVGGRSAWILSLRWDVLDRRVRHPSALKSAVALRRFLAGRLERALQRTAEG